MQIYHTLNINEHYNNIIVMFHTLFQGNAQSFLLYIR